MSRRIRRVGVTIVVAGAAATLLAACDKPLPEVTVLANDTVTRLPAARYCFDAQHCRKATDTATPIKADAGSKINIDVPKSVASQAWIVTAYTLDESNKATPIQGAGSTLLHGEYNARITVPYAVGSSYYIAVQRTDGTTADATWQASVEIVSS